MRGLAFLLSVRDEWWQGQTAILSQLLLLTIAASQLGLLNCGRWGPQPLVCKLALTLAFLSPTNSTVAFTCLYSFITPTCYRFFFRLFTQMHLWLTARSRVNIQHIGLDFDRKVYEKTEIISKIQFYCFFSDIGLIRIKTFNKLFHILHPPPILMIKMWWHDWGLNSLPTKSQSHTFAITPRGFPSSPIFYFRI